VTGQRRQLGQQLGRRHRRWGRRSGRERGASALEMAILTPAMLLLIMAIIQAALWFHARQVALAAAQEGARVLRTESGTEALATRKAEDMAEQIGGNVLENVTVTADRDGDIATVTVSGSAVEVVELLPLTVTATSRGPIERFVPDQ
jgi:Flp pilus assembly protein TadG